MRSFCLRLNRYPPDRYINANRSGACAWSSWTDSEGILRWSRRCIGREALWRLDMPNDERNRKSPRADATELSSSPLRKSVLFNQFKHKFQSESNRNFHADFAAVAVIFYIQ